MPYDTGDRKDVRKAEKDARLADRGRIEYLQFAMHTIAGRAWFHDFLETCHLFTDPFTRDALLEAYHKGERNVGLRIFADIVANCPDDYVLMMREAAIRNLTNGRAPSPSADRDADTGSGGTITDYDPADRYRDDE